MTGSRGAVATRGAANVETFRFPTYATALISCPFMKAGSSAFALDHLQRRAFDELRGQERRGADRHVAKAAIVNGVELAPEDRVFLMFGSANRDEAHCANADRFDLRRDTGKSIAFGAGPHFCAGAAASRAMIADVARACSRG